MNHWGWGLNNWHPQPTNLKSIDNSRVFAVIEFGEIVKARVVFVNDGSAEEIEECSASLVLAYQDEKILVMPTELSWVPKRIDLRARFKEGDDLCVKILRYAPNRGSYIGSIIRVAPAENNPYVKYATSGINAEYSAEVTSLHSFDAPGYGRVKLSDGVTGLIWFGPIRKSIQVGDTVRVHAIEVDYERGYAVFHLCND
ncbi:MAG TPA: hypothetical protein VGK58_05250 [Lacipirellulaceae bacterium]